MSQGPSHRVVMANVATEAPSSGITAECSPPMWSYTYLQGEWAQGLMGILDGVVMRKAERWPLCCHWECLRVLTWGGGPSCSSAHLEIVAGLTSDLVSFLAVFICSLSDLI